MIKRQTVPTAYLNPLQEKQDGGEKSLVKCMERLMRNHLIWKCSVQFSGLVLGIPEPRKYGYQDEENSPIRF